MNPFQVTAIQEVVTTMIVAGSFLTALWLFLKHRRPRNLPSATELTELTRTVEGLRSSVEAMRGELGEVQDRLDFTERLLAQATQQPRGELRKP